MAVGKYVCKEGTRQMLNEKNGGTTPEGYEVMLFSNDAELSISATKTDMTEITANGGAKKALNSALWGDATDADPAVSSYNAPDGLTFTFTGTVQVYGYAIIGATTGYVYEAENFGQQNYQSGQSLVLKPLTLSLRMTAVS